MRKWLFVMVALTVIFTGCSKSGTPSTDTPAQPGSTQSPAGGTATTPTPSTGSTTTGTSSPPATAGSGTTTTTTTTTTGSATPSGDTASKPIQAPAGAKEAPVTTAEQADKVDFGMSFDDVGKLMGQMGKLTSETKDEGNVNQTQTYEYKTNDGGTLKVTFHNGKVLNKSLSSTK